MYARISVYDIDADRAPEAAGQFRQAFTRLREVEGLEAAYYLRACEGTRGVTITFWESQAAMSASRIAASRLRSEAAASVEGEVVSVDEYEVAVAEEKSAPVASSTGQA